MGLLAGLLFTLAYTVNKYMPASDLQRGLGTFAILIGIILSLGDVFITVNFLLKREIK